MHTQISNLACACNSLICTYNHTLWVNEVHDYEQFFSALLCMCKFSGKKISLFILNAKKQIFLASANITSVFQMAIGINCVRLWTRRQTNKKDKKGKEKKKSYN